MIPGSLVRIRAESLDPNFPDVATLVLYTKAGILIPPASHFHYLDVGLVVVPGDGIAWRWAHECERI